MTTFYFLQISFVLLCITRISTLDCNTLHFLHNKAIQENLQVLDQMGQQFPEQCQNEKIHFKFPEQFLKLREKEDVKASVQEILVQIFYIFTKNLTLAAWDGRALEKFQNGLNQKIEHLEACLTEKIQKKQLYSRREEIMRLKLKKHFLNIYNFLKDKKYSLCSWEIIRLEIRRCLQFIVKVTSRLRN
ncbi:interferon kappa-like [Carettochelys insculpta]|uniref:interferon kappa-like n=1 Tax=Carettochelys insculpta TaxID=44489 RepID=UPI003EBC304E